VATEKIIVHGGGEHARVVLDCLLAQGKQVLGLFDPKYAGTTLMGVPQWGEYSAEKFPEANAIVAIGNNALRKKVVAKTIHSFTRAIHPSAIVSTFSNVGIGSMVLHGVIIQAQTSVGNHVILNTGARVDHDCNIGDYVHLAPGSILCGTVNIGEGALIGAGAIVLPGITVGDWAVVGAGAVVTRNVPDGVVVVGNPAKILKTAAP
jgi:sugar O-acyltransferase (sialic acid O-acetyltransferase NeuD family)